MAMHKLRAYVDQIPCILYFADILLKNVYIRTLSDRSRFAGTYLKIIIYSPPTERYIVMDVCTNHSVSETLYQESTSR